LIFPPEISDFPVDAEAIKPIATGMVNRSGGLIYRLPSLE
jgi:hypothetical protein